MLVIMVHEDTFMKYEFCIKLKENSRFKCEEIEIQIIS